MCLHLKIELTGIFSVNIQYSLARKGILKKIINKGMLWKGQIEYLPHAPVCEIKTFWCKMEKKKDLMLNLGKVLTQFYSKMWLSMRELFRFHCVSTTPLQSLLFISNAEIFIHLSLPRKNEPENQVKAAFFMSTTYK